MAGQMKKRLDLSSIPAIHILSAHLPTEDLHEYEDQVFVAHGNLTYDPKEARVFLARISQKKRAAFELRSKGVWTEEDTVPAYDEGTTLSQPGRKPRKRRRLSEESSTSNASSSGEEATQPLTSNNEVWPDLSSHVLVIKIEWLDACLKHDRVLPYQAQLIYYAKLIPGAPDESSIPPFKDTMAYTKARPISVTSTPSRGPGTALSRARRRLLASSDRPHQSSLKSAPLRLHRTTTSERDFFTKTVRNDDSRSASPSKASQPPLPSWATGPHASYSCCRSTRMEGPNKKFIAQLSKIKESRILTLDSVGVRAYSTAMASISAYAYRISQSAEIVRLPGCNERIASLWQEWHDSASTEAERAIAEVKRLEADTDLQVLDVLYNIWGVGADTARRFYFNFGWKDLDDIVESGWQSLSRVQQIGVKYYDEFLIPIPRAEVESIAATIKQHARQAVNIAPHDFNTEADIEVIIVGGYRRGKAASGDVDVILSHRDETVTKDLVVAVVRGLEDAAFITHTLVLHTTTSDRDQATLPFRSAGHASHGFDSLDKALCVWQDPVYPSSVSSQPSVDKIKNPNLHRRVDIILSPWRTVGCAVLGWSGGTTFQRDIRRFAKKERGWKFDSSGVRERGGGMIIDLERPRPWAGDQDEWEWKDDWQSRERRLMDGLGIGWRPPEERCTG
ncbi:hypothetical protein DV736_g1203, partial [Chaetothyriales sp. CBS 134916]